MAVYVPKFVVQVKEASDAVSHRRDGPVSRQDVFVKLEMGWRTGPVQQSGRI